MTQLICTFALLAPCADEVHLQHNPVFRLLVEQGAWTQEGSDSRLPPPTWADGLSKEEQARQTQSVLGDDYRLADFLRRSSVAPQVIRMSERKSADPSLRIRCLDVYFATVGTLEAASRKDVLEGWASDQTPGGSAAALSAEELTARGIDPPAHPEREVFGHAAFNLLNKVDVRATGRLTTSTSEHSIIAAGHVDPRFNSDANFPNEWRPSALDTGENSSHPYPGAGFYIKATKHQEQPDMLLVELHVVLVEPMDWFGGANLLGSKLPAVLQNRVRAYRRAIARSESP